MRWERKSDITEVQSHRLAGQRHSDVRFVGEVVPVDVRIQTRNLPGTGCS